MHVSRMALMAGLATIAIAPAARAQDSGAVDLGSVVFEAESDDTLLQNGYVAESGRQATKLDTDISRIPQSIGVVTQDQLEDQQPRTLLESLSYSAGAGVGDFAFDTRYDAFYLRGFPAYNSGFFRDGLRQVNGPSAWYRNDPYTLEGAALLKGPASSLYGVSGPGGLVNLVSKRPKADPFREIKLTGGTDDRAELAFDVTGAADDDARVLYRLTGILRDADTPLDGYQDDKTLIAPALTFELGERTTVTLLGEYSDSTVGGTASYYNPSYGEASEIYNGDPDYNDFDQEQWRLGYEVEHELTDAITLRHKLRYSEVDVEMEYSGFYDTGSDLARYWGHYLEDQYNLATDTTAEFEFTTGGLSHEAVVGVDYTESAYDSYLAPTGYVSASATDDLDAPYNAGQDVRQTGVYVHDQITAGNLSVFLSARHDWVEIETEDSSRSTDERTDEEWSGRLGVSYAFANGVTPYASLSSAFVPNTGLVFDPGDPASGRAADPTTALQKEIGVKYRHPTRDVQLSAALFDIRQENGTIYQTLTAEETDAFGGLNQIQVPYDLRSRGLELEGSANLGSGLRLMGSYTYLDMEIEEGAEGTEGNTLSASPEHTASVWAFWEPEGGTFEGWGFGGGLRYVGESWGDDENSFENDDYLFADLAMSYDFGAIGQDGLALQVNVKNLFDEDGQTCSAGYCYRYEGRTATASIGYRF
ncbi:TonB-dependent siderophore receptor [Roseivivax sediminis]|uniref:Iron complex outermembrane recepter protein n=1 Tax=Roseivivax sediminis TaxID=936889 RepID=A0A1I1ZIG7_9RHOB|nr:TonB-dependent siderophore receptor [Roseivivax sediminis]SFE31487.1 iron complex outermembrane recepter protein [Roseivivax sediminis]